ISEWGHSSAALRYYNQTIKDDEAPPDTRSSSSFRKWPFADTCIRGSDYVAVLESCPAWKGPLANDSLKMHARVSGWRNGLCAGHDTDPPFSIRDSHFAIAVPINCLYRGPSRK